MFAFHELVSNPIIVIPLNLADFFTRSIASFNEFPSPMIISIFNLLLILEDKLNELLKQESVKGFQASEVLLEKAKV